MSEDQKKLKNHQLLEICGEDIFKKIKRKKILQNTRDGGTSLLDSKLSNQK
jgi:hypothetical protein